MKNTCPECGTAYNVANAPVGRKFTCKKCNTPVIVTEEGLDYQNPPAKAAPAPAAGGAFEFDDADEAPKPPKAAKPKPKGRPRDEDEDAAAEEEEAPRKPKKKPARARDLDEDEPADADEDDRPARRKRPRGGEGEGGFVADLIGFTKPAAPAFIKLLFFAFAGAVLLSALLTLIALLSTDGMTTGMVVRLLGAELLTVAAALFVGRVLAELAVVGFTALARVSELKAELEKANATLSNPPAPPAPAAPPQPAPAAPVVVIAPPAVPVAPPTDGPLV